MILNKNNTKRKIPKMRVKLLENRLLSFFIRNRPFKNNPTPSANNPNAEIKSINKTVGIRAINLKIKISELNPT